MGNSSSKSSPFRLKSLGTFSFSREDMHEAVKKSSIEDFGDLKSRVELTINCKNLAVAEKYLVRVSVQSTSDPLSWVSIGSTETSLETRDPEFSKTLVVDFCFEMQQKVKFELLKIKAGVTTNEKPTEIEFQPGRMSLHGTCEMFLAEILAGREKYVEKPLEIIRSKDDAPERSGRRSDRKTSQERLSRELPSILVLGSEMKQLKSKVSFDILADSVPSRSIMQLRNPFVMIKRSSNEKETVTIFRSEIVNETKSPKFARVTLSAYAICLGEPTRPILLELWDWLEIGDPQMIGCTEIDFNELEEASSNSVPIVLDLSSSILTKSETRKSSVCKLILENIAVEKRETFLDYIQSGLEMSLMIGIDFTKSNKESSLTESLHYFPSHAPGPQSSATAPAAVEEPPNDYVLAIRAISEILQHYDSEKKYPVYGFGARLPPNFMHTSHCFACNGNYFSPEVQGIDGILKAYKKALDATQLHGPTFFHDILKQCANWAEPYVENTENLKYFVLLILTDGVINDLQKTINEIVKASRLPISIIIVGIGDDDFSLMNRLDSENEPLQSTEEKAHMERDIVQFVPFNDFKDKGYQELALGTLDKIPSDILNYYRSKDIKPSYGKNLLELNRQDIPLTHQLPAFLEDQKKKLIAGAIGSSITREDIDIIINEGIPCPDVGYLVDIARTTDRIEGGVFSFFPTNDTHKKPLMKLGSAKFEYSKPIRKKPSFNRAKSRVDTNAENNNDDSGKNKKSNKSTTEPLCKMCYEKDIDVVLLPCGHLVVCQSCATDVCPLCGQKVNRIAKT
jgi:Copine/Zinc finger, C3HC4 type (RING finger)/C2 domain